MASAVPPVAPPTAHTSTQQWQSFEMRMRQRRIDRLLLRAQIAHEAGRDDAAQEALAEAEELNGFPAILADLPRPPAEPTTEALPSAAAAPNIEAAVSPELEGERRESRPWVFRVAAMLTVAAALGWFAGARLSRPAARSTFSASTSPTSATSAQPSAAPTTPAATAELPAVRLSVMDVTAKDAAAEATPFAGVPETASLVGRETPVPQPTAAALTPRVDSAVPAVAQLEPSSTPPNPPALPAAGPGPLEAAPTGPAPVAPPIAASATSASPRSAVPADLTSDVAPPVRNPSDDAAVRAALASYEAAYSHLDAEAAGAIWPGLDRKALARAFDGLASQSVNLGSCDVRVVGEVALADCAGTATWTPKVGGGSRSQQRRWQFRLRNAPTGWQIVGATAR